MLSGMQYHCQSDKEYVGICVILAHLKCGRVAAKSKTDEHACF